MSSVLTLKKVEHYAGNNKSWDATRFSTISSFLSKQVFSADFYLQYCRRRIFSKNNEAMCGRNDQKTPWKVIRHII